MIGPVARAYHRLRDARPLVRPSYSQYEVTLLPPYGDPEVHVPSEVATYLLTGAFANYVVERLDDS